MKQLSLDERYIVSLDVFEGPLDLLLYLIRRQNLDILDIPIAEITRQYIQYIEVMKELQLELAGEYLVMAAMLAEIKSRMLLPRPEATEEDEDDPRAELVRRLQEYERYKQAAEDIEIDGIKALKITMDMSFMFGQQELPPEAEKMIETMIGEGGKLDMYYTVLGKALGLNEGFALIAHAESLVRRGDVPNTT